MAATKTDIAALEAERRSAGQRMWSGWSPCAPSGGRPGPEAGSFETYEADTARLQGELDRVSQDQANQAKASVMPAGAPKAPWIPGPRPKPTRPGPSGRRGRKTSPSHHGAGLRPPGAKK